jgi:hypothetical protein
VAPVNFSHRQFRKTGFRFMPNPRKPAALKVVAGTDRPDRPAPEAVDLPLVGEVPPAPDWMPNPHAIKEWDRLAAILHANKMLTEAGLSALGVLCALHGELVDQWARRNTPTGHMLAQYRALVNDFGLTPVAQGKVKSHGEGTKPGGRFATVGKR